MVSGRLRLSRFLVVPLTLALLALSVGAPVIAAKNGGNSANAKMCQKGGWMELQRSDGTIFANQRACVTYAAKGGKLEPKVTAAVLDQSSAGGASCYSSLVTYLGQTFTAGLTGTLTSVALEPYASLQGLTLEIRTTAGGLPTSTVLASQTITSSVTGAFVSTTFATPAAVTAGTQYAIVLALPASGVLGCAGGYAGGDLVGTLDGVSWLATDFDLAFETWVSVP
jgi:hypothetical protein